MKKTPTSSIRPPVGRRGQAELLPFSRARARNVRGVLRATPNRVQDHSPKNRNAVTPRQFGRYQVLHPLGQGTMSAVFLAKDPYLSRLVAVKVLHPDLMLYNAVLERFFKEAKTVSRLPSPHIVGVYDLGMEGRTPYLVMEYIDGQTLQKVMDHLQGKPLDPIVACALLVQVLDGLSVASEAGIVHRDLKPENLMLTQKGYVKLTDFGICHVKDHAMTATGEVFGPPRFMSPEQVLGLKPITPQSDLFTVGVVFYYLLSGKAPFAEENKAALFRQIVEEPHPPLSEVRPGLDRTLIRWVDTLLEKDPSRRGEGPAALSLQLKKYLLKKKVAAPVDRIGRYVRELNAAGFKTTSALPAEQVREWMGSLNLKTRPGRTTKRKVAILIAGILLVGAALGGFSALRTIFPPKMPVEIPAIPIKKSEVQVSRSNVISSTSTTIGAIEVQHPHEKEKPAHISLSPPSEELSMTPSNKDAPAILTIISIPPFADISVDGHPLGRTPLESTPLSPGLHHFSFRSRFAPVKDTAVHLIAGPQTVRIVLAGDLSDEGAD